jgi:hypothetical protein
MRTSMQPPRRGGLRTPTTPRRSSRSPTYDCLRGECGLCAVDILRLEGEADHRDVFLSDEEKRSNRRICTCVSRIAGGGVVIDSGFRDEQ